MKRLTEEEKVISSRRDRSGDNVEVFKDRFLSFSRVHGLEARERKLGQLLKVLLPSPLLFLTDIPHIYNDNMHTFPPGGK